MRTGGVSWGVVALGGLAAFLLLRPRPAPASSPSPSPTPATCPYSPGSGLSKSYEELIYRIHERIREVRPALGTCIPASGTPCTMVLASALASSINYGIPPDIATALAWRESRFNLYLESERIRAALVKGRCTSAKGTEIGPPAGEARSVLPGEPGPAEAPRYGHDRAHLVRGRGGLGLSGVA